MARTLSDFAAMAGVAAICARHLVTPAEREVRWMTELYRGLEARGDAFRGRDRRRRNQRHEWPAVISISAVGTVEKGSLGFSRTAAKPATLLFVTGRLGGSIRGRHLDFIPRIVEARWLTSQFSHPRDDGFERRPRRPICPRLARASGAWLSRLTIAGAAAHPRLHDRGGDQRRRRLRTAFRACARRRRRTWKKNGARNSRGCRSPHRSSRSNHRNP